MIDCLNVCALKLCFGFYIRGRLIRTRSISHKLKTFIIKVKCVNTLPNGIHGKLHVLGDCIFHLKHSAGEVIITQVVMEFGKAVVTRAEKLVALSRKVSGTLSF